MKSPFDAADKAILSILASNASVLTALGKHSMKPLVEKYPEVALLCLVQEAKVICSQPVRKDSRDKLQLVLEHIWKLLADPFISQLATHSEKGDAELLNFAYSVLDHVESELLLSTKGLKVRCSILTLQFS